MVLPLLLFLCEVGNPVCFCLFASLQSIKRALPHALEVGF